MTADAALAAEPILKEIFAGKGNFGCGERKILITLGIVIGIEAAQLKIQRICKRLQVVGLHIKFYQPLMTTALVGLHIDRGGGVVADVGTGGIAGGADGAGGIVLHKLLAKSVDEMLRATRDADFVGANRRKFHRVADDVTPQTAVGADDNGIIDARLDIAQRNGGAVGVVEIRHRDKFVINPIVQHQEHIVGLLVVLERKETLRSIVSFEISHLVGRDKFFILSAVRLKTYSAVHK